MSVFRLCSSGHAICITSLVIAATNIVAKR
jgi:hypothetical protein